MAYQVSDAERGYAAYDPIADEGAVGYSNGRKSLKPVWIGGLMVCGVVVLSGMSLRSSAVTQIAVDYDASRYMPKTSVMACLQSSCNQAVGALSTQTEDDADSRDLVLCLTSAGDGVTGRACFKDLRANPSTKALYTCAICKQCIPGDVSPKKCAEIPASYNDLRGAPAATGPSGGSDYTQYTPGPEYSQPPAFTTHAASDHIQGTTAAWGTFLAVTENADVVPSNVVPTHVIPTNVIPNVKDEVSSDLHNANDQIHAGLAQAQGLSPEEKERIESKIEAKLRRVNKKVKAELSDADDEILRADHQTTKELTHVNDKVNAELDHANEEAETGIEKGNENSEAGLEKADEEIAEHVDNNPNVPDNVPANIPQLGTYPADSRAVVTTMAATYDKKIGDKDEPSTRVHGGDPLEYVPTSYAADGDHSHAKKDHSHKDHAKKNHKKHPEPVKREPSKRAAPATRMPVTKDGKKPAEKPNETEKRLMNGCMQMNCNSAIGGLGAGIGASPSTPDLARCIQDSKTTAAANKCFKQFPSPEGDALQTCMICEHCLSGNVAPEKCLALERNPNDIRGPPAY